MTQCPACAQLPQHPPSTPAHARLQLKGATEWSPGPPLADDQPSRHPRQVLHYACQDCGTRLRWDCRQLGDAPGWSVAQCS
ncbi:hypothetical protein PSQ39_07320 [Curvibacter sp. HBC28]|uniref:Uncharacterized protein n=1 Tax=Curvibacter microcysteis TaxID=3026419 RepID=A0ABT5MCX8_9BURK|nr:hypothetical protein [Curvibacter sp. HBC28]MDD0814436.1 hypothetical protein [Curvibacter sp. HBC28]